MPNGEWTNQEDELVKKFDEEIEAGTLQQISFNNPDEMIQWLNQA